MSENAQGGGNAKGKAPQSLQKRSGDVRRQKNRTPKRAAVALVLALVLLLLAAFSVLAVYAAQYDTIFPNIYVGEHNLGGKTAEEALELLNQTYLPEKIEGVKLAFSCRGDRKELPIEALALEFCNDKTVEEVLSKSDYQNPLTRTFHMARRLLQKTQIEPTIHYKSEVLKEVLDELASPYEVEPVGYTFQIEKEKVTLHGKVNGIKAKREPLIAEAERQMRAMAFSEIAIEPEPVTPEPLEFDEFYRWLTEKPQDAYYEKSEDGKVQVKGGKLQCSVDRETVKNALLEVDASAEGKITFPVKTTAPKTTAETLTEELYRDQLGSYTTYYSGSAARNHNVQLATARIHGIEMMPGDEFSYDKTILPRTYQNGYRAAPVYVGNKVESGMGGGICQPSSTLYCAVLYANLEILERHNHSMLVGYLPAGMDATIAEGYLDFRFRNNSQSPIKIEATAQGGKLTFSIWGTDPDDTTVELLRSGSGYNYSLTRVVKKNGVEVKREKMGSSRYVPKETEPPEESEPPTEEPEPTASAEPGASAAPSETPDATQTPTGQPVATTPPPTETPTETPTPTPSATPSGIGGLVPEE